jgi:hypothetical protein
MPQCESLCFVKIVSAATISSPSIGYDILNGRVALETVRERKLLVELINTDTCRS